MRRTSLREHHGFTLVELLVVILIIGILVAIALPVFLGQRSKAQDTRAKSDARNMASQIETCWHTSDGYVGCTATLTGAETGLSVGNGPAQVQIVTETQTGYEIKAVSQTDNHIFRIVHNIGGSFQHSCTPAGKGGCKADGTW